MTQIAFIIPGRIGGKGRPRAAKRGKFITLYTPQKTRTEEGVVRHFAAEAMRGVAVLEGPLGLDIKITQTPPPSWSNKKRAAAKWIAGKPDYDNIGKLIGDSLNNVVWTDDSQVARASFERRYSLTEPERVEVVVTVLE